MHDIGLINFWLKHADGIDPTIFLKKNRPGNKPKNKSGNLKRLTLGGLSGAFIVLEVGCSLAIVAFIFEVVYGYYHKTKNRNQYPVNIHPLLTNSNSVLPGFPSTVNVESAAGNVEDQEYTKKVDGECLMVELNTTIVLINSESQ